MKLPVLLQQGLNEAGLEGNWTLTPMAGGDTARSAMLEDGESRYFVKQHRNPLLLEAEALGLETLAPTLRVPRVVHCHSAPEGGVLILEYLDIAPLTGSSQWMAAGSALACLHRTECPALYGHHPDNYIGGSAQSNTSHSDWVAFFANERLLPQWQRARQRGLPTTSCTAGYLPGHPVPGSMVISGRATWVRLTASRCSTIRPVIMATHRWTWPCSICLVECLQRSFRAISRSYPRCCNTGPGQSMTCTIG